MAEASRCKAGQLLGRPDLLPQPDRALFRSWVDTGLDPKGREVSAVAMANALCAEGHPVGPTTLKDHRGKRCVCWRPEV